MSNNVLRAGSALAMSLALAGCLTSGGGEPAAVASADQPAGASQVQELVRCERPLGSAAVTTIPAIIGLFRSSAHSSFVKLVLSAIDFLPM